MANDTWTEENIAKLKQMYAENYSMSQIAIALRTTRNAVSGKIARLDLYGTRKKTIAVPKVSLRRPRSVPPHPRGKPQRVIGSLLHLDSVEQADPEHRHTKVAFLVPAEAPPRVLPPGAGRLVTFDDLGPNDCRSMVDPHHYCGQTKGLKWNGERSSYCQLHHDLYHDRPRSAYRDRRVAVGAGPR